MSKQRFWNDDRQGSVSPSPKPNRRDRDRKPRDPRRERQVRDSLPATAVTLVTRDPDTDMIAAMRSRGRSYVRLLLKAGLDADRASVALAHVIVRALDEPAVTIERGEMKTLDGVQTLTIQLDTLGVNRRDPIHCKLVAEAFVDGGLRELERLGI